MSWFLLQNGLLFETHTLTYQAEFGKYSKNKWTFNNLLISGAVPLILLKMSLANLT